MSHAAKSKSLKVLVIEDEMAIREMLCYVLKSAHFEILESGNTQESNLILEKVIPDIILLDWMLPGGSGVSYIKTLKSNIRTQNIPIVMLTARAEEHNKITGLESGADDYITKPFSPKELIARIKSVLRRGGNVINNIYYAGNFTVNSNTQEIFINHNKIKLTGIEYKLMVFFITHPKKLYTREQILNQVWQNSQTITDRTIDANVKRLRTKLKFFGAEKSIKTQRGSGYQFVIQGE